MDSMDRYEYDSREERIFLAAYFLWLLGALIGISNWHDISWMDQLGDQLQNVSYLLFAIQFFGKKKYTWRDVAGIFLIILTGIAAYRSVYNRFILDTMILVYFSAGADQRSILKLTLITQVVFMTVTVAASQISIIPNEIWEQDGNRIRYALGYLYCSYSAHLLLFLTLIWFVVREKVRMIEAIVLFGLNTILFRLTDSRTDYLLSIIAILGFLSVSVIKKYQWTRKLADLVIVNGGWLMALIAIAAQVLYDPKNRMFLKINQLLNERLAYGKFAVEDYGVTLFGKVIRWIGQGTLKAHTDWVYNYVDCSYLKDLLTFGVLFLAAVLLAFYLAGKRVAEQQDYLLGWAMIVAFAYSMINAHLCVPVFNVFVLMLGCLFRPQERIAYDRKNPVSDTFMEAYHAVVQGIPGLSRETADSSRRYRFLRCVLFFALFWTVTLIQRTGTEQMLASAGLYRYIISGIVLLLAGLMYERRPEKVSRRDLFQICLLAFFLLAVISDVFMNKKFQYAALTMLIIGGLFVSAWRGMKEQEELLADFKQAFKLFFVTVLIGNGMINGSFKGIFAAGVFVTAKESGIIFLMAAVVFLDDVRKKYSIAMILNLAGYVAAFAGLYVTRQKLFLVTAVFLTGVNVCLIIAGKFRCIEKQKKWILLGLIVMGCAVLAAVFWFRWKPSNYLPILQRYLKKTSLLGHAHAPKYKKVKTWAENSFLIHYYRYGIPAAFAYACMVLICYAKSCLKAVESQRFLPIGIMVSTIAVAMTTAMEFPFVHMGWLLFWLGIAGFYVQGMTKKN